MTQETRNKIYAIGAAVIVIAGTAGIIDVNQQDQVTSFLESALVIVGLVWGLVNSVIAFIKSMRSKVTVVEVPKDQVASVNLVTGREASVSGKLVPRTDL